MRSRMRFHGSRLNPNSGTPHENAQEPTPDVDHGRGFSRAVPEFSRDPLRWIFIGDDGLRAGWSILLFSILWFIFAAIFAGILQLLIPTTPSKGPVSPSAVVGEEIAGLQALVAAALICNRIERRPIPAFYLAGPRSLPNFLKGLLTGFASLTVLASMRLGAHRTAD